MDWTRILDGQTEGKTNNMIPIYPPKHQTLFAGGGGILKVIEYNRKYKLKLSNIATFD